jgi:hypothetical protein
MAANEPSCVKIANWCDLCVTGRKINKKQVGSITRLMKGKFHVCMARHLAAEASEVWQVSKTQRGNELWEISRIQLVSVLLGFRIWPFSYKRVVIFNADLCYRA